MGDSDEGREVTLHVYDLSGGMAAQLSMMFIGRQINGIWHSGVVVGGTEYYWGGDLIAEPAGRTQYGKPVRVVPLGITYIPDEMIREFIEEVRPRYNPSTYSLLSHNCNNFSNELATFLTGSGIPEDIVGLPDEVMSTPFGQAMRPFLEQMERQQKSAYGTSATLTTPQLAAQSQISAPPVRQSPPAPAPAPAPQPVAVAPPPAAAAKPAPPVSVPGLDELDDLVNSLDMGVPPPQPKPAAAPAPQPSYIPPPQTAPAPAPAPAPASAQIAVDELDSILGELDSVAPPPQQTAYKATPPPAAAPAPAAATPYSAPRPAAAPMATPYGGSAAPAPAPAAGGHDELDSLMKNLSQNMASLSDTNMASSRGVCGRCGQPITGEVVQAMGKTWHPEHFTCQSCRQPLGTQPFYESDGQPTCGQCWKSLYCPHCAHCDQPITDRCVTALGKKWHPEHFMCSQCLQPLTAGFLERDGHAFCERCFYSAFSFKCAGCGQPIRGEFINAMGERWHPEHFSCFYCHKSFAGGAYFEYQGKPYCEQHYHQVTGAICAGCGLPVGTRSVDALGKKWHPEHFVCAFCNNPLGGGSFKEHGDKAYCSTCFVKLFS